MRSTSQQDPSITTEHYEKKNIFLSLDVDMETILKCMNSAILNTNYSCVYVLTAWGETNLAPLPSR